MMNNLGSREIRQIKRDFSKLSEDIADIGSMLGDVGADRSKQFYRQGAQQARRLRRSGEGTLDSAQDILRERPISSALFAVGVACVLGVAVAAYRKSHYEGE